MLATCPNTLAHLLGRGQAAWPRAPASVTGHWVSLGSVKRLGWHPWGNSWRNTYLDLKLFRVCACGLRGACIMQAEKAATCLCEPGAGIYHDGHFHVFPETFHGRWYDVPSLSAAWESPKRAAEWPLSPPFSLNVFTYCHFHSNSGRLNIIFSVAGSLPIIHSSWQLNMLCSPAAHNPDRSNTKLYHLTWI